MIELVKQSDPEQVLAYLPGSDPHIRSERREGSVEPTNFRDPARWNSVPVPARVAERAYTNVDVDEETGCWISRYSVASHGYSQVGWNDGGNRHMVLGHRASWVHVHGQMPLGMTLDHVCKTRRCVNPAHLRMLPNYENARRTYGDDWPMGFCKHGHSPEHIAYTTGRRKTGEPYKKRFCRECDKAHKRRWREKNRKAA